MAAIPPNRGGEDGEQKLDRRDFLKLAGAGAGLILASSCSDETVQPPPGFIAEDGRKRPLGNSPDVVVIGAGAFGGWTAYHLLRMGARVTLVDAYGPGNSRATSGDETRGIRSSYGDRSTGELWMQWAREAISRWRQWDDEWGREFKWSLFFPTGDLIMRAGWEPFVERTKELWDKLAVPYEVLTPEEVRYRWPVINLDGVNVVLYEIDAGVARARRSCQAVASVVEKLGGKVITARAQSWRVQDGKLAELMLSTGETLRADSFVFACGPWLGKVFPELLGNRIRIPMGYVAYFATGGDARFEHPNLPSFNFPGVTGWPTLPVDSRGLRVRGSGGGPTGGARGGGAGAAAAAAAGAGGGRGNTAARGRGEGDGGATADTAGRSGGQRGTGGRTGRAGAAGDAPAGAGGRTGRAGAGSGRGGGGRQGAAGRGAAAGAAAGGAAGGATGTGAGAPVSTTPSAAQQSDPDLSDRWMDANRIEGPRRFLALRFPLLAGAPVSETRACHYEGTSSRNFIIDKHPDMSNVWISGGGNSEGFKFGPVVGEYTAQRVLGDEGDAEIAAGFRIPEQTYDPPPSPPPDTTQGRGAGSGSGSGSGAGAGGGDAEAVRGSDGDEG